MDLTSRLLEQFVVLAEERHFGRAAERLSMSQPPLSQAMRRLERGLGVELLDRNTRGVRLTAAGEAFAEDARRLLDSQTGAIERARRIARGVEGSLRMGYTPSIGYWFTPRLVALAAEELPGLHVQLRQQSSRELMEAVRVGVVDVAFVRSRPYDVEGLECCRCAEESFCIGVPPGHRLARAESVRLEELADEEFVLPSPNTLPDAYHLVAAACQRAGFAPSVRAYAEDLPSIVSYTAAGVGVSFVLESVAAFSHGMVSTIALESAEMEEDRDLRVLPVFSLRRSGADTAVLRLLDLVRRQRTELVWQSRPGV